MSLQAFLKNRWSQSGLKKNENILLHSSFKRTFNDLKEEGYKFNPEDILDSLLDLVTPDGTLVLPTFNFDFNTIKKYDYYNTKSQMGIVTELARQRSDFTRTLNPVYSFAVYGKDAYKFENIDNVSWYSKESPFKIIHKDNYKICIIDLEERNSQTFAHYCEEYFQVPWRYYKEFSGVVFGRIPSAPSKGSSAGGAGPSGGSGGNDPEALAVKLKEKLATRGARGIIGLQRQFKIMDDDNSKSLNKYEFSKAMNDFMLGFNQGQIS